MSLKGSCAIVGVGETKQGRHPDRSIPELMADAVVWAIQDAGLEKKDVDGFVAQRDLNVFYPYLTSEKANDFLFFGDQLKWLTAWQVGGASTNSMVAHASAAIMAQRCRVVVIAGAGMFPPEVRGEIIMANNFNWDFEAIYGPNVPTMNAIAAQRHMYERGFTVEHLARICVYQRRWALMNPNAFYYGRGELTVEQVLKSRIISSPLTLLMCSTPVAGACALVVTSADVAKSLDHPVAYVLGEGESHPFGYIASAPRTTPSGAYLAAKRAYEMAGITSKDISLGACYDAFASHVPTFMEDMGFGVGRIGEFIDEGHMDVGGDLPWNTCGGLLEAGQAANVGHVMQTAEGALQIMGKAGERQVKDAKIAAIHGFGGMQACHSVLVLGRLD